VDRAGERGCRRAGRRRVLVHNIIIIISNDIIVHRGERRRG
jgi:hypothetical protein